MDEEIKLRPPRVAFFPDSYVEVNGVATTSRRLTAYAGANGLPLLCVHAGPLTELTSDGAVSHLSLKRSSLAVSMDEGLAYDPLFQRHTNRTLRELMQFKPEVIHITGLNDVSILGAYLAWKLEIPLMASWHTNLHEFAGRRLGRSLRFLPSSTADKLCTFTERKIFDGAMQYYRMPKLVLAPNQELVDEIGRRTRRETRIMSRGVDTALFSPEKRSAGDGKLRIGYVGRLRAEKNPRVLFDVERRLLEAGLSDFEFLIVGEGSEREWLERNLKHAVFTGFLTGDDLATAYANMDVFLFPSETDTFGNVVQEALSSGVPAIVSDRGGPKFIVRDGETGLVARTREDFGEGVLRLMRERNRLSDMKTAARAWAISRSWEKVFDGVWDAYRDTVGMAGRGRQ